MISGEMDNADSCRKNATKGDTTGIRFRKMDIEKSGGLNPPEKEERMSDDIRRNGRRKTKEKRMVEEKK